MNQERILNIILKPHLSEKANATSGASKQYVFKVVGDAKKAEVKKAVETLFKVEASKVNVVNIKSKPKKFGRYSGKKSGFKKAYVWLKPGFDIDLSV